MSFKSFSRTSAATRTGLPSLEGLTLFSDNSLAARPAMTRSRNVGRTRAELRRATVLLCESGLFSFPPQTGQPVCPPQGIRLTPQPLRHGTMHYSRADIRHIRLRRDRLNSRLRQAKQCPHRMTDRADRRDRRDAGPALVLNAGDLRGHRPQGHASKISGGCLVRRTEDACPIILLSRPAPADCPTALSKSLVNFSCQPCGPRSSSWNSEHAHFRSTLPIDRLTN